jgi:cytochrome b involved in lipid metabolism
MANTLVDESELQKHTSKGDLWVTYRGTVLDVSKFADLHPGGFGLIHQYAGKTKNSPQ